MATLIGSIPTEKIHDPQTFSRQVKTLLERYPESVVIRCCDPQFGVVRKTNFVATLHEIADYCDAELASIRDEVRLKQPVIAPPRMEKLTPEQVAERKAHVAATMKRLWPNGMSNDVSDRRDEPVHPVIEKMKAGYAEQRRRREAHLHLPVTMKQAEPEEPLSSD